MIWNKIVPVYRSMLRASQYLCKSFGRFMRQVSYSISADKAEVSFNTFHLSRSKEFLSLMFDILR